MRALVPESRMPKPLRILFTIPNFMTAGSGRSMLDIVERLDRTRFEPSICVLRTGGRLEERIRELGIPLLELPFTAVPRPLASLPGRLWNSAQQFRPYRFDLWHSFHYSDDYTEPIIARLSGTRAWVYTKKNMMWRGRAWRVRSLLATKIAALNTAMLQQFFDAQLLRKKTRVLAWGVDADAFKPGLTARLGLRQNLGISQDTFLIGCVAQLVRVKGHPTLLRALVGLPDAHLVLAGRAGDDAYANELHGLCADLGISGRAHFLGEVVDTPALLAELDVFVLPTLGIGTSEALGVALLEAMACGLPCIATDTPGPHDVIEPGVSGLLIPPEDREALARAIQSLRDSVELRRRLGVGARARVLARYTIEHAVADHEALYSEVLNT